MLKNVDPGIVKIVTVLVVAGLVVASHYFPDVADTLLELAAGLGGWQLLRRAGDTPPAGADVPVSKL